ncbi:MAG: hypothetical protein V2A73_07720 [Pseudomonadota bacterium]
MRMMLEAASTLTAEDLEFIRSDGVVAVGTPKRIPGARARPKAPVSEAATLVAAPNETAPAKADVDAQMSVCGLQANAVRPSAGVGPSTAGSSRGDYERQRTRESKTSTICVGEERVKHPWWPVGTELVGQIGREFFTATVVENLSVKSGRSVVITSGPAQGKVCITPTRAAVEATEAHRQANNLGRSGGVTNGWVFWQPRTGTTV